MLAFLSRLFSRPAKPKLHHPLLGELEFDCGIWECRPQLGQADVSIYVAGTPDGPYPSLLGKLESLLSQFAALRDTAVAFLTGQINALPPNERKEYGFPGQVDNGEFELYSLDLIWETKPGSYALEFLYRGSDVVVWRVTFELDQPTDWGFED